MKERVLRLGLVGAIALAVPAGAVATGPGHGQEVKAEKQHHGQTKTHEPQGSGKPAEAGKPATAAERPHNHGWYVSQVAHDKGVTATGADGQSTHGAAVSAVAKGDQGK